MLTYILKLTFTFFLILGIFPQIYNLNDCEGHGIYFSVSHVDCHSSSENKNTNAESDQHKNCGEHAGLCYHSAFFFLEVNHSSKLFINFSIISEFNNSSIGKIAHFSDGPFRPPLC